MIDYSRDHNIDFIQVAKSKNLKKVIQILDNQYLSKRALEHIINFYDNEFILYLAANKTNKKFYGLERYQDPDYLFKIAKNTKDENFIKYLKKGLGGFSFISGALYNKNITKESKLNVFENMDYHRKFLERSYVPQFLIDKLIVSKEIELLKNLSVNPKLSASVLNELVKQEELHSYLATNKSITNEAALKIVNTDDNTVLYNIFNNIYINNKIRIKTIELIKVKNKNEFDLLFNMAATINKELVYKLVLNNENGEIKKHVRQKYSLYLLQMD
jgi:hypothetical protein